MTQTAVTAERAPRLAPATPAGLFGLAVSPAIVAYVAVPAGPGAEAIVVLVTSAAALAVLAGVALHGPQRRSSWSFLAAGLALHAIAAAMWALELAGLVGVERGATATAFDLLAYPPMLVGAWGISARRLPEGFGDRRWVIGTFTISSIVWMVVTQPALAGGPTPFDVDGWSGVGALLDLVIVLIVGRRVIGRPAANRSLWLTTAAFVAWGDAHGTIGDGTFTGSFVPASVVAASLMIGPALLGIAALLPSMACTEPTDDEMASSDRRTLGELLAAALLVLAVTSAAVVATTGVISVFLGAVVLAVAMVGIGLGAPLRGGATHEECADDVHRSVRAAIRAPGDTASGDTAVRRAARPPSVSDSTGLPGLESGSADRLPLDQLELAYLPYVDLRTGVVLGAEALVRRRHPTLGVLDASEILGSARDSAAPVAIDDWVVSTALRTAASWSSGSMIGINVSAARFTDPAWAEQVVAAAREHALDAERIIIETSGRAFAAHDDPCSPNSESARCLRAAGVRVAVDFDGRIGSLSTLGRAPVDIVKFRVGSIAGSPGTIDGIAVRAANAIGLRTALVGIDDRALLARGRAEGADVGQGFLLSSPLTADVIGRRFDVRSPVGAAAPAG